MYKELFLILIILNVVQMFVLEVHATSIPVKCGYYSLFHFL